MDIKQAFRRPKKVDPPTVEDAISPAVAQTGGSNLDFKVYSNTEAELYRQMRAVVPIIDAAICKIVRLCGSFKIETENKEVQKLIDKFVETVQVNSTSAGLEKFVSIYLDQLIMYGTAVGEIIPTKDSGTVAGLINVPLENIVLTGGETPLDMRIFARKGEELRPCLQQDLILISTLDPQPGELYGTSLLKSLPFVSKILMTIFNTIGQNFHRVGNVRYAVSYKGGEGNNNQAQTRANQIATQWSAAMRSREVKDFVSIGEVDIKAIGADGQVLDSQIPSRLMIEQIVAKTGVPPFMLGLSWSTSERMSKQQADILTSEMESYRRLLTPIIKRICERLINLNGYIDDISVEWDYINLQDEVELAKTELIKAQTVSVQQQNEALI